MRYQGLSNTHETHFQRLTGILSDSIVEEVVGDVKVLSDTSLALEVLLSILKQLLSL